MLFLFPLFFPLSLVQTHADMFDRRGFAGGETEYPFDRGRKRRLSTFPVSRQRAKLAKQFDSHSRTDSVFSVVEMLLLV